MSTMNWYTWLYGIFIEIQRNLRRKRLHRTNQGSKFLADKFNNRDNIRPPIQFKRESQPQLLKRWFFIKNSSIHFHINSTSASILDWSNKMSCVFPTLKSTGHFLSQSTVSSSSELSSEANSGCCHRSDAWSHLE